MPSVKNLHIEEPVGNYLEFAISQDGTDEGIGEWQESRDFATLPNGSPFIFGEKYAIYARDANPENVPESGYNYKGYIIFGDPLSQLQNLDDVCQIDNRTSKDIFAADYKFTNQLPTVTTSPTVIVKKVFAAGVFEFAELPWDGSGGTVITPVPPQGGIADQTLTVGSPYSLNLVMWQNAQSLDVSGLPAGISFNPVLLRISGTPTEPGVKDVLVTGISSTNVRVPIPVKFTVQAATQTYFIQQIYAQKVLGGVELFVEGAGQIQLARTGLPGIDFGISGGIYQLSLGGVSESILPLTIQIAGTSISVDIEVDNRPEATLDKVRVYPGIYDLLRQPALKGVFVTSGGDPAPIVDDDNETEFATDNEAEPAISVPDLRNAEGISPFVDDISINAITVANWRGAYVIFTKTGSLSRVATLQENLNRPGVYFRQIPGDQSANPIILQFNGESYRDMLIQKPGNGILDTYGIELHGSYASANHPPTIEAIEDVVLTEGQALSLNLNGKVSDVDGDAFTLDMKLGENLDLPDFVAFDNGILASGSLPWQGSDTETSKSYSFTLIAKDTTGAESRRPFNLIINRANTLPGLNTLMYNFDNGSFSIAIDYPGSGFLQGNLVGVSPSYQGGWRPFTFETPYDFAVDGVVIPYNRIINYYSGVQNGGTYQIQFRTQDGGPAIFTRTITINGNGKRKVTANSETPGTTPTILSIAHRIDSSGKPIIDVSATVQVPRVRLVSLIGTGWGVTDWANAVLVSGNSNYSRAYNAAAPFGSYRYDVEFEGIAGSLQSGSFVLGPTAETYILKVERKYLTATTQTIRVQTASELGLQYKFPQGETWTDVAVSANNNAEYSGDVVISGAKKYTFVIATQNENNTLQLRQTGSSQILGVPITAGPPANNGAYNPLSNTDLFVTSATWAQYDENTDSGILGVQKVDGVGDLEVLARYTDGTDFSGVNQGEFTDSGPYQSNVWYPMINDNLVNGYNARRRYEKGSGTGIVSKPMVFLIRKKNTTTPIQTLTIEYFTQGNNAINVTGGTTTPVSEKTGVVLVDILHGNADAPDNLVIDSRLTLEAIGKAQNGQDCTVGTSDRFIGTATIPGCIALARKAVTPGSIPDIAFHRYGISIANMRAAGWTGVVRFLVEIKKVSGTGNAALVRRNLVKNAQIVAVTEVNSIDWGATGTNAGFADSPSYTITTSWTPVEWIVVNIDADTISRVVYTAGGGGGTPAPTQRIRRVGVRDHGINLADLTTNGDVERMKSYWDGFTARGGNEVEFTVPNANAWNVTNERAGIIALVNKAVALNVRVGIHLNNSFRISSKPAWVPDSVCQRWNTGGLVETDSHFLSLALLEAWDNRVSNPSGWNDSNPWYKLAYDCWKPVIDNFGSSVAFYTFGCQKTEETGYSTHDTAGVLDRIAGYEDQEKALFKVKAIEWSGGTIGGFNSLFGTGYGSTSDTGFTLATPYNSSADALRSVYGGNGIRQASYLYRCFQVRRFQRFCEWVVRTLCGSSAQVGAEFGTTANVQASLYGSTHVLTNVKTADFFRENLATGPADDLSWVRGAHRIWSTAPNNNGRSDLDGADFQGYQKSGPGGGAISQAAVLKKLRQGLDNAIDVVFFAYSNNSDRGAGLVSNRTYCYQLTEQLANLNYPGTLHPIVTPQAEIGYTTSLFRNGNNNIPGDWDALSANGTRAIRFRPIEESVPGWPLTL